MVQLTTNALKLLLMRLDPEDVDAAADKYERLREKLIRFFCWRGAPGTRSDLLAEEAIDRLATKLEQGINVENINAYALQIGRFVWLEYLRTAREDPISEDFDTAVVSDDPSEDTEIRLVCLRKCLQQITAGNESERAMILGYYDTEQSEKNKDKRRVLAEKFGLTVELLRVRACRLRMKLEKCVRACAS